MVDSVYWRELDVQRIGAGDQSAARIVRIAEAGTILIEPDATQRIEGLFSTKEIGKKKLKNVRDEVMVYQVVGIEENNRFGE